MIRGRGGFTLIEVLVAVAILVILFGLMFGPMFVGFDYLNKGDARTDVRQNAALAMDTMLKDIRESVHVYLTDDSGTTVDENGTQLWVVMPARQGTEQDKIVNRMDTQLPLSPLMTGGTDPGDVILYFVKTVTGPQGNVNRLMKRVYDSSTATYGENSVTGGINLNASVVFSRDSLGQISIDLTVSKPDDADGTIHRLRLPSKAAPKTR